MSTLKPSILINPNYATNNLDTKQAGWYQIQPTSSNVALRVSHSNIGLSGEIRLNNTVTPPLFQGNNGSGWVSFNATRGPTGPSGRDFTNQVNFNNLTATTNQGNTVSLGSIFATTYVNVAANISNVNIRSLQGSSYTINSNLSVDTISLTQNSNVITINTSPIPYTWDFTGNNNTVSYLKTNGGGNSNSWGETSKWIVQTGQTVYKGQAVTIVQNINSTHIVIAPITYTTLNDITQISPFNILGIATNTASSGAECLVCTKGITTIRCTNQVTNDFIRSDSVSTVGTPGIVGKDGFIFNNQNPYPGSSYMIPFIKAGYFLEGNPIDNTIAANGNYALFYVDPVIYTDRSQIGLSDRRLKENIENISQTDKDKLLQLVPKTYNFIKDDKKVKKYGLIAQEVEGLFPEIVTTNSVNDIKALNYIDLIPLLLEKVKELDTTINELLHKSKSN
jgi:hypothetical protein